MLAVRAGQGDQRAEAAFVARTIDDVWRYCAHMLDANLADDATQATFLRALPALGSFRGDSSVRTWLLGVARNTCLDERRTLGVVGRRMLETDQVIERRNQFDHQLPPVERDGEFGRAVLVGAMGDK